MRDAYIYDWVRTPRGKARPTGGLADKSALDLLVTVQTALIARTGVDPARIEDVIVGIASQVEEQGADLARTATLMAGWPESVSGLTVNRFCASGIEAVSTAAAKVRSGDTDLVVAGGVESVSRVPIFSDRGPLWSDPAVVAGVGSIHMGVAADVNATIEGFTREQLDEYALQTHRLAHAAWESGFYDRSVVPTGSLSRDELIRPGLTMDALAQLPPAFAQIGADGQDDLVRERRPQIEPIRHLHTVGSSPQMADGAAVVLMGSDPGLEPRGRVVATATCAVDPVIMLTAGQEAMTQVIQRAGLTPADIDVFEFAEAFAALCLRFARDLGVGPDRMNPNGGTIAMGHAFGATGTIMVGGCLDQLERSGGRYGVAGVSAAAGMGVAVLIERLS